MNAKNLLLVPVIMVLAAIGTAALLCSDAIGNCRRDR